MNTTAVIIPLYNGADWIAQTLEAVLAQSRPADDIVVVDDGSTDGGPEIVARYAKVRLLSNPQKGANPARVFGIASTDSTFLALLDQDDCYAPDHLEKLSRILDEDPNCPAAVGNNTVYQMGSEPAFADWPNEVECFDQWAHFPFLTVPSPSGALFRRAALEQVGGWPTHIEGVADILTFFRVSAEYPIQRTAACTWARGEHHGSYSAKLRGPGFMLQYMDRINQAAEEALEVRLRYRPDQSAELLACLKRFSQIKAVLEAIERDDRAALRHSIVGFESAYAQQPERVKWLACSGLSWMVSLAGKRQADGNLVASFLMRNWPASAPITGALVLDRLESMVGRSMAVNYFLAAPFAPDRICHLVLGQGQRLIRKAKRVVRG